MSKGITLFSTLMQSLSHHLRPAPYPYGLLTLRLLGKLGGKNRQFLRDPMQLNSLRKRETSLMIPVRYPISHMANSKSDSNESPLLTLPLPLSSCVETIRSIALTYTHDELLDDEGDELRNVAWSRIDPANVWDCQIEDLDIASYSKGVIDDTKKSQALAGLAVLKVAIAITFSGDVAMDIEDNTSSSDRFNEILICKGLLYACMIDSTKVEAINLFQDLVFNMDHSVVAECLSSFLSEPSSFATTVGLDFLVYVLNSAGNNHESGATSLLLDSMIHSLCESCCSCSWGKQSGLRQAISKMTSTLGCEWSRKYEVILVNANLLAVKSVPRELSEAAVNALSGFVGVCVTLYGDRWHQLDPDDNFVWDVLAVVGIFPGRSDSADSNSLKYRPCEDVFKIIIYEMTSHQPLVR
jgi:transformation/transcription domain-associated protein